MLKQDLNCSTTIIQSKWVVKDIDISEIIQQFSIVSYLTSQVLYFGFIERKQFIYKDHDITMIMERIYNKLTEKESSDRKKEELTDFIESFFSSNKIQMNFKRIPNLSRSFGCESIVISTNIINYYDTYFYNNIHKFMNSLINTKLTKEEKKELKLIIKYYFNNFLPVGTLYENMNNIQQLMNDNCKKYKYNKTIQVSDYDSILKSISKCFCDVVKYKFTNKEIELEDAAKILLRINEYNNNELGLTIFPMNKLQPRTIPITAELLETLIYNKDSNNYYKHYKDKFPITRRNKNKDPKEQQEHKIKPKKKNNNDKKNNTTTKNNPLYKKRFDIIRNHLVFLKRLQINKIKRKFLTEVDALEGLKNNFVNLDREKFIIKSLKLNLNQCSITYCKLKDILSQTLNKISNNENKITTDKDFQNEVEKNNYEYLFIIDPGICSPVTYSKFDAKTLKFVGTGDISSGTINHLSHKNKNFNKMNKLKNKQNIQQIECGLPTLKVTKTTEYVKNFKIHLNSLLERYKFYSQKKISKLKFDNHLHKQKTVDKLTNDIFGKNNIVGVGHAIGTIFKTKIKHPSCSSSAKKIVKKIKENGNKVMILNENLTSKTCNKCMEKTTYLMKRTLSEEEVDERNEKKEAIKQHNMKFHYKLRSSNDSFKKQKDNKKTKTSNKNNQKTINNSNNISTKNNNNKRLRSSEQVPSKSKKRKTNTNKQVKNETTTTKLNNDDNKKKEIVTISIRSLQHCSNNSCKGKTFSRDENSTLVLFKRIFPKKIITDDVIKKSKQVKIISNNSSRRSERVDAVENSRE